MKNSFRGVFHCRKTKAWFCFAREFNGLRHRIRRYIHVPQGSSDLVRASLQTAAPDAVFERYCTPLVCRWSGPGVVAGKVADAQSFRPRKTVPGLRANDAMAGLLTHRSTLAAAFPELGARAVGIFAFANSCGAGPSSSGILAGSSRFTVAGTATDSHRVPTPPQPAAPSAGNYARIAPANQFRQARATVFRLRPATQRGLDLCGYICRGQRWPIIGPCPKQKVFRAKSGV